MTDVDILKQVDRFIATRLIEELRNQGHYLTGAVERSIHGEISKINGGTALSGTALYYAKIIHAGASADRIPFQPGSGAKTSKYIDALIGYFKLRGLAEKEAKSAAFATAKIHKKEGMPTSNSHTYSSSGERLDFINIVKKAIGNQINNMVNIGVNKIIMTAINKTKSETI